MFAKSVLLHDEAIHQRREVCNIKSNAHLGVHQPSKSPPPCRHNNCVLTNNNIGLMNHFPIMYKQFCLLQILMPVKDWQPSSVRSSRVIQHNNGMDLLLPEIFLATITDHMPTRLQIILSLPSQSLRPPN